MNTQSLTSEDISALPLWVWPGNHCERPEVPSHLEYRCRWAVAILYNGTGSDLNKAFGKVSGIYVHKNAHARDMDIDAARSRPDIGVILVSDLQSVDRRWRMVQH